MKFHGIQLEEGSAVANMTVVTGTSFPDTPNEGELFFRSDASATVKGLYVYIGGSWDRVASSDSLTAPNGAALPGTANAGDLFYLNSNDSGEGLYAYSGSAWVSVGISGSAQPVDADLTAIAALSTTGIAVRTATDTWATRSITGSAGRVSVTDGDGVAGAPTIDLSTAGTAGTYTSVTTDAYGRVTSGSSTQAFSTITSTPTTLTGYGITDAQALDADLTAIAALVGTTGLLRKTAADTWSLETSTYLTGNQSITVSGDVTGTGSTSIATTLATVNSNVGSFGSASAVPTFTVNGKGLLTAAGSSSIAIDTSQVSSGTFADARIAQSNVTQHQASLTVLESQITDGALLARVGGNETITGNWSFSNTVIGTTPTGATHLATKGYVDDVASGMNVHGAVETATTAALPACTYANGTAGVGATLTANANGAIGTVGGYAGLAVGSRVLVKDQASALQNGIYSVTAVGSAGAPFVLTRTSDFDGSPSTEIVAGDATYVQEGTLGGTQWVQVTIGSGHNTSPAYDYVVVGTDSISFTQFSGSGTVTGGTGITVTGNSVAITAVGTPVSSSFVKITTNTQGQVSGTTPVLAADVTALVDATYVNITGDTMTGALNLPSDGLVVGTTQLVVSAGNVGVGGAPSYALDVVSASATVRIAPSTTTNSALLRFANSNNGFIGLDNSVGSLSGTPYSLNLFRSGAFPIIMTTNDAERMRIDASGNVGVGTSTPTFSAGGGIQTKNATFASFRATGAAGTGIDFAQASDGKGYVYNRDAADLLFGTSNAERMRIDTVGNLGINTAPSAKLHVKSTSEIARFETTTARGSGTGYLSFYDPTGRKCYLGYGGGTDDFFINNELSGNITLATSGQGRMFIDASGNVGIGAAPSAWVGVKALQIDTAGALSHYSNFQFNLLQGTYYDAGYKYTHTGVAVSTIALSSGEIHFQRAAAGTAAAALGLTSSMVIDASGNVGIGVAPSAWQAGNKIIDVGTVSTFGVNAGNASLIVGHNLYLSSAGNWTYKTTAGASLYTQLAGAHNWFYAPSGTAGTTATLNTAMTLDNAGNVGIGGSAPSNGRTLALQNSTTGAATMYLQNSTTGYATGQGTILQVAVVGAYLWNLNAGILSFGTSATERMQIDASGNISAGGTLTTGTITSTGALIEKYVAVGASNLDLATASVFSKTISTATTFTVSNIPASGKVASFMLDLTNGGSAAITWWSGVKWEGGTAPTLTTTGRDTLGFFTYDGGTTWTGLVLGKDIK